MNPLGWIKGSSEGDPRPLPQGSARGGGGRKTSPYPAAAELAVAELAVEEQAVPAVLLFTHFINEVWSWSMHF